MDAAVADDPTPGQALFLAAAVLAKVGPTRSVFAPVWVACPALAAGDRASVPTLRSDAADRPLASGQRVTWPLTFLHLVAESARMARPGPTTFSRRMILMASVEPKFGSA